MWPCGIDPNPSVAGTASTPYGRRCCPWEWRLKNEDRKNGNENNIKMLDGITHLICECKAIKKRGRQ
jgi:hypothetical protein